MGVSNWKKRVATKLFERRHECIRQFGSLFLATTPEPLRWVTGSSTAGTTSSGLRLQLLEFNIFLTS